jgi:hypothetical protein
MTAHDDDDHDHDGHLEPDLDDEDAMPGPSFLTRFRQPVNDEELEEIAKAFIVGLEELLDEIRREIGSE